MLSKGVVRESHSPLSAPAILVPKRSLDGKPKYRFCVVFRALNAVTKFDSYPLPVFEETTSTLFGSKFFLFWIVIAGSGRLTSRKNIRNERASPSRSGTMNLIDCRLDYRIALQIFKG